MKTKKTNKTLKAKEKVSVVQKSIIPEDLDYHEMVDYLEEYYESAGFDDAYNKIIKGMTEKEIRAAFNNMFAGV